DGVGTNCTDHQNRKNSVATTRNDADSFAITDIEPGSGFRMDFHVRLRTLLDEKTDASRLIARQVLKDDPAAGQYQWKLIVRNFVGRIVFNRMEFRFAVGMIKTIFEESRCSRMIFRRTRPKDAVVLLDFFPGYAVIVGFAATRCHPQLLEHVARRIESEILLATH